MNGAGDLSAVLESVETVQIKSGLRVVATDATLRPSEGNELCKIARADATRCLMIMRSAQILKVAN